MERVAFAGELAGEVGIALPITEVGAMDGSVAAGGEAAVRERVFEDVADRFAERGAAGKVAAVVRGVAPVAVRVPMPGGHAELGIVAIGDGPPAPGEGFLNVVGRVDWIVAFGGKAAAGAST